MFSNIVNFDQEAYFKKYGRDRIEKSMNQYVDTDYPKVKKEGYRRRFIYETFSKPIEETYFWIYNHFTEGRDGYPVVEKIMDVFTSAEQSSLLQGNLY